MSLRACPHRFSLRQGVTQAGQSAPLYSQLFGAQENELVGSWPLLLLQVTMSVSTPTPATRFAEDDGRTHRRLILLSWARVGLENDPPLKAELQVRCVNFILTSPLSAAHWAAYVETHLHLNAGIFK